MSECVELKEVPKIDDMVIIKGSEDVALLNQIEVFRIQVWAEIVGAETAIHRFSLEPSDFTSWHFVHLYEGKIIACARLTLAASILEAPDACSFGPYHCDMQFPLATLNRLVVDGNFRSKGLAAAINVERIRFAKELGVRELWVEVANKGIMSMEILGFSEVGPSADKTIQGDWKIMRLVL